MKDKSLAVKMVYKKPPSILAGIAFTRYDHKEVDEETDAFLYAIKFKEAVFVIEGQNDNEMKGVLLDPIFIKTTAGDRTLLFDHSKHGYNGVFGIAEAETNAIDQSTQFNCPECSGNKFHLILELMYEIWDDEIKEDEEIKANISDIFTAFSLFGECQIYNWKGHVCSFECA